MISFNQFVFSSADEFLTKKISENAWWRHGTETPSSLLSFREGNLLVTGVYPRKFTVTLLAWTAIEHMTAD